MASEADGECFQSTRFTKQESCPEEFIRIISFFFSSFIPFPSFLWLRVRVSVCLLSGRTWAGNSSLAAGLTCASFSLGVFSSARAHVHMQRQNTKAKLKAEKVEISVC